MFFSLTDEQRALQSTVRDFIADRFPLTSVRAVYDDPASDAHPLDLWKSVADQGWLAVTIPEEYDGIGLGLLDAAVLARCWGEGCVPGPLLTTLVAAEAIRIGGDEATKSDLLPRVAAGDVVLSAGDGTGLVEMAHVATSLVLPSNGKVWLVSAGDASIEPQETLDRSSKLCKVNFDVASATELAISPARLAQIGAVIAANDLAGVAAVAMTTTVEYLKTRKQFGVPVGSFQALKHSMADLHVASTMTGHAGWYAAHAIDAGLPDADLAVSVAKAKASDTARNVTAAMIQFHGGIGFTWEHDAHFFFKRAKRLEYAWGDASSHRELIAKLVIDA